MVQLGHLQNYRELMTWENLHKIDDATSNAKKWLKGSLFLFQQVIGKVPLISEVIYANLIEIFDEIFHSMGY